MARCCARSTSARFARRAIPFTCGWARKRKRCWWSRAWPTEASTFERLQAAGKLARSALEGDPKTVLVWQQGCTRDAADATFHAVIAALEAAAFRFATFKSKPKSRTPLRSIDLARRGKLHEMDVTLATAAGNNLARWLTALPPNTLDAAGYRRLLQQFAQRLKLNFKFYGERQLKRLGAGAFLAVSRGNALRDAGIAFLSYRPRGAAAPAVSLVGKGICFDTGGTNLKAHKGMLDMHTDMEGSAVALGSLYALHDAALAAAGRLLAGDHRKQDRSARLQAAGCGAGREWHDHSGHSYRCRGPDGAG